jgi:pheromone shutdown protein TraB
VKLAAIIAADTFKDTLVHLIDMPISLSAARRAEESKQMWIEQIQRAVRFSEPRLFIYQYCADLNRKFRSLFTGPYLITSELVAQAHSRPISVTERNAAIAALDKYYSESALAAGNEMSTIFPNTIHDERDRYMTLKLRELQGAKTVVAVCGAAHLPGITRYWERPLAELRIAPTAVPSRAARVERSFSEKATAVLHCTNFILQFELLRACCSYPLHKGPFRMNGPCRVGLAAVACGVLVRSAYVSLATSYDQVIKALPNIRSPAPAP